MYYFCAPINPIHKFRIWTRTALHVDSGRAYLNLKLEYRIILNTCLVMEKTILLADSGSTKTDWLLLAGNSEVARIATQGINPFMLDEA